MFGDEWNIKMSVWSLIIEIMVDKYSVSFKVSQFSSLIIHPSPGIPEPKTIVLYSSSMHRVLYPFSLLIYLFPVLAFALNKSNRNREQKSHHQGIEFVVSTEIRVPLL